MGVISSDAYVEIYIGPAIFNGVKPVWGATASVLCKIKGLSIQTQASKKDAGGACGVTRNRYGKETGTLRIEAIVQGAGYISKAMGAAAPLKRPIIIRTKPNSALATYDEWMGVITDWEWNFQDDEPQAENVVVDLTPDWD